MSTPASSSGCTKFVAVASVFFSLGLVFQLLLLQELHEGASERVSEWGSEGVRVVRHILPFHLRSEGASEGVREWRDEHEHERGGLLLRPESKHEGVSTTPSLTHSSHDTPPPPPPLPCPHSHSHSILHSPTAPVNHSTSARRYYRDIIGELPEVVKAWRSAKLDWHELLPKHMSTWERFGEKKGLRLLVSKEEQITDYLTRFTESGLADAYGRDHGPLLAYSGCNKLRSDCMIHPKSECQTNGLCMWNPEQELCVDYELTSPYGVQVAGEASNGRVQKCPAKGKRGLPSERGVVNVKESDAKCKMWVDQPAAVFGLDGESQSMFYHWIASWSNVKAAWKSKLKKSRQSHIFMTGIVDTLLYGYFGMISDFCWRRSSQELQPIPDGLCFCDIQQQPISQGSERSPAVIREVVATLGLNHVTPPADRPKIGIISRRKKRFILNEFDLADIAMEMGYDVVLLPLETMTYYEQVREFRSLDELVGLHGSALDNVLFLNPGSVMLQLMPWKNEHRATFMEKAKGSSVEYMEWSVKDLKHTVLHWDLYAQADTEKLARFGKQKIMDLGQKKASSRETLMFWINQDIIVPEDEWRRLLGNCVMKSNAKKRLNLS